MRKHISYRFTSETPLSLATSAPFFGLVLFHLLLGLGIVYDISSLMLALSVFAFAGLLIAFIHWPRVVVLFLLVIRPSTQILMEFKIGGFLGVQMFTTILLLLGFILFFLSDKLSGRKVASLLYDPVVVLMSVYLLVNIISYVSSAKVASVASISCIFRFFSFLCMYVLGKTVFSNNRGRELIFYAILLSLMVPNMVGLYQYTTETFHFGRGVRAVYGTFLHPNMYANYLVVGCIVNLYFLSVNKHRSINYCFLAVNIWLLANTFGRAAAIALGFAVLLVIVMRKRSFIVYVLLAAAILVYLFPDTISDWLFRFSDSDKHGIPVTLDSRMYIWSKLMQLFLSNPLLGVGPSTFHPYYCKVSPHNEILRNLAEVGLLGTVAYVLILIVLFRRSFEWVLSSTEAFGFFVFLTTAVFFWLSLTSNLSTNAELQWCFWIMHGSMAGLKSEEVIETDQSEFALAPIGENR